MFLKTLLIYFQKICFFNYENLKKTMSRKESKFYVISFIDPRIIFLKKKILKPCAIKTHIQIPQKNGKSEGSR